VYSSPNIIRVIISRRVRWVEHVACGMYGEEEKCKQGFGGETCRKETKWNMDSPASEWE
jgi:hypothetical protein